MWIISNCLSTFLLLRNFLAIAERQFKAAGKNIHLYFWAVEYIFLSILHMFLYHIFTGMQFIVSVEEIYILAPPHAYPSYYHQITYMHFILRTIAISIIELNTNIFLWTYWFLVFQYFLFQLLPTWCLTLLAINPQMLLFSSADPMRSNCRHNDETETVFPSLLPRLLPILPSSFLLGLFPIIPSLWYNYTAHLLTSRQPILFHHPFLQHLILCLSLYDYY